MSEDGKAGILPLLYPQSLSDEEVERRLGRPLTGDPTRGERGVMVALGRTRIDAVRRSLEHDGTLGADFKEFIGAHLADMERRWQTSKAWRVQIPAPVWEEYARESRMSQRTIAECLSAAIQRDYERRMDVSDSVVMLEREVRGFHATAMAILQRLEAAEAAAGKRDVTRQLQRIEDAISRRRS
jgi:hypothetical protein